MAIWKAILQLIYFYSDGGDIGDSGNVGKYTDALMVHVTKSVSGLKSETFNFGLFDNSDKLIEVKSLTFSSNGTSSFDFTQINTKDSNGTGALPINMQYMNLKKMLTEIMHMVARNIIK